MKNIFKIITLTALLIPSVSFAQFSIISGGTGWSTTTKGDIFVGSSTYRLSRLPVGSNGKVLTASSSAPSGLDWTTISSAGGSGVGTWSTTTSNVAGRLINYPNNTTDIPTIGSTATSTADYWFDPNTNIAYLGGSVGVGTTSPIVPLDVLSSTGQALSVTGGVAGVSIAQFSRRAGVTADVFINASGGDPQLVFSRLGTSEFSIGDDTGVFKISGSAALGTNDILSATTGGNVGIGSSSPSSTLSVTGNMYQRGGYTHFGTADSGFACRTISTSCIELIGDDNTDGGVIFQIENRNAGTNAFSGLNLLNNEASRGNNASFYSGLFLNGSNYSNSVFGNLNNVPRILQLGNTMGAITIQSSSTDLTAPYINLALNNLEIARITPFGLGVGTTSARFPVQIAATTTPQLVLTSNGITETNWAFRNAGGNMYIQGSNPVTFATTSSPTLSLSSPLNQVAIGTSTFAAGVQLTIGAGANPVATMFDSISATGMYTIYRNSNIDMGYIGSAGVLFSGSAGVKTDFAVRGSTAVSLGVGSGEDMRIASTGFVGIGTTSPYARLAVVGQTVSEYFTATSTTATSIFSGSVAIGTTTTTQKLQVDGGIRLNTATSKPTCDSTARGTFWAVQSGVGVKDTVEVCAKDAGDAYAWRTIY